MAFIELTDQPSVHLVLMHVGEQWKVSEMTTIPSLHYNLSSDMKSWLRLNFQRAKEFGVSEVRSQASKRLYDQLVAAERKHCK